MEARSQAVPAISYPAELPVSQRKDEIAAAIRDHQVVIIAGETGSGKTTQLPKICLELGRGMTGQIGHTQPRRIAARTVAERIAAELGTELGAAVGYKVRFTDTSSDDTLVKVMTDGILLAEMQRDRQLLRYDTLIIDEAHERSLNIDFILGYLRRLLPSRPDLKVIITSATIDSERFSEHFAGGESGKHSAGGESGKHAGGESGKPADAPVIEVSGRTYPVEVRYRPLADPDHPGREPRDQVQGISDAVDELRAEGPATSWSSSAASGRSGTRPTPWPGPADLEVLPLYARLSAAEQHRVFQPHRGRRVVLATNVAETSLTVPGIKYVIDAGTARISRYSLRTKVQRLPIEPVSQASANQRKGRCGRTSDGVCIRLYSEEDFASRPEFTDPEILRTNLASVILQMAALGLGEVGDFPFVDPPESRNVADGVRLLEELGAVAPGRGRVPAHRRGAEAGPAAGGPAAGPDDPGGRPERLRQRGADHHRGAVHPGSPGAARGGPRGGRRHARALRRAGVRLPRLPHACGTTCGDQQRELSGSAFRRMCRREYLHYLRVREWQDVRGQLRQAASDVGIAAGPGRTARAPAGEQPGQQKKKAPNGGGPDAAAAAPAARRGQAGGPRPRGDRGPGAHLAAGRPAVAHRDAGRPERPQGKRRASGRVRRRPGRPLRHLPRLVAGQEAAAVGHRGRAGRDLPAVGQDRRRDQARVGRAAGRAPGPGAATANRAGTPGAARRWPPRRSRLYGLPIVAARPVGYATIDPAAARELFIQHALVEGDWQTHHRFFHHNRELLDEAGDLERRARRRGIVVDDAALFDFYDRRIPADVTSARHFDAWWKKARASEPELLTFSADDLVGPAAEEIRPADYPDAWGELPLSYEFAPGEPDDGVTADVPLALLNQVSGDELGWQVPGLREELVTELIRSLPKQLRTAFVPVPDTARAVLARLGSVHGDLLDALAAELGRIGGVRIPRDAWDLSRLPAHLRMTFRVLDGDRVLASRQGSGRAAAAAAAPAARRRCPTRPAISPAPGSPTGRSAPCPGSSGTGRSAPTRRWPTPATRWTSGCSRPKPRPAKRCGGAPAGCCCSGCPRASGPSPAGCRPRPSWRMSSHPYPSASALLDDCAACAADAVIAESGGPAWDAAGFARLVDAARSSLAVTTAERGRGRRASPRGGARGPDQAGAGRRPGRRRSTTCAPSSPR